MKAITVFTPTYNRVHTISRTYESLCRQTCDDFEWLIIDDGSTDDTRKWVESLGEKVMNKGSRYDSRGFMLEGEDDNHFSIQLQRFKLTYIYKPNGGLHTGYNTAISNIDTELNICIDSDDYMPDNAIELIVSTWHKYKADGKEYAGIVGLDYVIDGEAIGGKFPDNVHVAHHYELTSKYKHHGDTKIVCRTDLIKKYAPMTSFDGEKNFNPIYLYIQVDEEKEFIILNQNLCFVDYQIDGMSAGIFRQFWNSPNSFAALRELNMSRKSQSVSFRFKNAIHYVSSCIRLKQYKRLFFNKYSNLVIPAIPFGILLYLYINHKRKQ